MKKYMILVAVLVLSNVFLGALLLPTTLYAYGDDDYGYYPSYRRHYYPRHYNPVVRRDYYNTREYESDGTRHEEDKAVDRHSSYYSPGRNQAITRPRTTVESWSNSPSEETTKEKTTWVGADGRPHSTTVTRDTTTNAWGDTHTDTHVELRRALPKN